MHFHPYAEIFPLLESKALDELAADIKEHGQRQKITLLDGKILDGRNRFMACKKAGIKPETCKFTGDDPLAFVISANMHRRHLTVEQRAIAGARIATFQQGDNQHTARAVSSQAQVAEQMGVSTDSIQRAKKIVEHGSKALQHAVEAGEIPLKKAAAVVDLPKSEQLAAAKAPAEEPEYSLAEFHADEAEIAQLEEKEYRDAMGKIIDSDDRFAAFNAEVKRLSGMLAVVTSSRDHYQRQAGEAVRLLQAAQQKIKRLEKKSEPTTKTNGARNGHAAAI